MVPTSIQVYTDAQEYSRLERNRNTIYLTITPSGTGLVGEELEIALCKGRRARDEVVETQTLTLEDEATGVTRYTARFYLPDVVDADAIALTHRGDYFVRVKSLTDTTKYWDTIDFRICPLTNERWRKTWLHGVDIKALDQLLVKAQPQSLTGITVIGLSPNHPRLWLPLAYGGSVGTVLGADTVDAGTTPTVIQLVTGGLVPSSLVGGIAQWLEEDRRILANTADAVTVYPGFSVAPVATNEIRFVATDKVRTLRWGRGPEVALRSGIQSYVLRLGDGRGGVAQHYIEVTVDDSALPLRSGAEDILVDGTNMNITDQQQMVDDAISYVENVVLDLYIEPTRVVTDPARGTARQGTSRPSFAGATWDKIIPKVTHFAPAPSHWAAFDFAHAPLLRVNRLYGEVVGQDFVEIPTECVQFHEGGFVEIVPSVSTPMQLSGVQWNFLLMGNTPIPNFWHIDATVGFRDPPGEIIEFVAKKAAADFLAIAGQASFNVISDRSVSKDGISASVHYTTSAMYGIYSATIIDLNNWLKANEKRIRQAYRGLVLSMLP